MNTPHTRSSVDLNFLGTERFDLIRQLGRGNMGAVYLAHDNEKKIDVALKTLRRMDGTGIYRFKQEFRGLTDIVHPNLVTLHELFHENDLWFFTMDYVEGKDFLSYVLHRTLRSLPPAPQPSERSSSENLLVTRELETRGLEILFPTPMKDEDRLRQVLIQICQGLMELHEAGILHRDLKSENVLVTQDGRAVVLDFGIILDTSPKANTTADGAIGTPAYMSPEQAAGLEVAEATDWYALGVMLYESLTGDVPFDGTYLQVIQQKQKIDPQPPSQVVGGVPEDLNDLCMQLLSRDPSRRPTGQSILRALERRRPPSIRPARMSVPAEPDTPFVGRDRELDDLKDALSLTDDGRPVMVFVTGHSGIGKTTLVERFLTNLVESEQAVILQGKCYEREKVPFKAFDSLIDSLTRYLRRLHPVEAAQTMPRDIQVLAQLFPVLRRVEVVDGVRRRAAVPPDPKELRRRAFAALKELLCRVSDRYPLVLFIDDLQWGDVDSARLITELVSGSDSPALLFVASYRGGEVDTSECLQTLFAHTRHNTQLNTRHLGLAPLTKSESEELARHLLGADLSSAAGSVGSECQGNPHMLAELVEHVRKRNQTGTASRLTGEGVVSFERALQKRVADLSNDGRTLLELVSVAGRPVSEDILALVSAFDIDLQAALVELRAAKLIRGVGTHDTRAIETYHDRIRQTVLRSIDEDRLVTWHRRLATSMEASGNADLEALTEHLIGAKDAQRAEIYALRAAQQAEQALAFDKAARLYSIAVSSRKDEAWGQDLLEQWADALVNAGRGNEAAGVFFDAAQRAEGDSSERLRRRAGIELLRGGRLEEGLEVLAISLRELGLSLPATGAEALAAVEPMRAQFSQGFEFVETQEDALPIERMERVDTVGGLAVGVLLNDFARAGTLIVQLLREALELGEASRLVRALCLHHTFVDSPLSRATDSSPQGALALAESLQDKAGEPEGRAWIGVARGFDHMADDAMGAALSELALAEEGFRTGCHGRAPEVRLCRLMMATAHVMDGRVEHYALGEEWAREAEQHGDQVAGLRLRMLSTFQALRVNDPRRGQRQLDASLRRWGSDEPDITTFLAMCCRSAIDLFEMDAPACHADVYRTDKFLSATVGAIPMFRIRLLLWRARVALMAVGASTDREGLLEQAERALAELQEVATPHLSHQVTLVAACLRLVRGDTEGARGMLQALIEADSAEISELIRICALLRMSDIAPAGEATPMRERVDVYCRRQGISDVRRFIQVYAPLST